MTNIDWNYLRAFHATAATGTLSAAARQLGLTQPTLSRQIQALEEAMGLALFDRVGRKLVLTQTGSELLSHINAMGEAAQSAMLVAKGGLKDVSGRVRISASDSYSVYILPEIISHIMREAPLISVEVVTSDAQANLHRMEADIAIRHAQPDRTGLTGHHICDTEARFYASKDWVARNGIPAGPEALAGSDLIGIGDTKRLSAMLQGLGFSTKAADFKLISDSSVVAWEMVRRGMGVAAMVREIAARSPDVISIFPDMAPVVAPIWLVSHKELQASPRIQVVHRILARELARILLPI